MASDQPNAHSSDRAAALQQTLLRRALAAGDPARLQVRFHAAVVDRYRSMAGARLMRTRTVGRVSLPNRWSLDLGIVDGEDAPPEGPQVHVAMRDLLERLPAEERDHWLGYLVPEPASLNFLQMQMAASACIDDGDTEDWT